MKLRFPYWLLFAITGFADMIIYITLWNFPLDKEFQSITHYVDLIPGFVAGYLFIFSLTITLALKIKTTFLNICKFIMASIIVFSLLYGLTYCTSFLGLLLGIITSGLGSSCLFFLVDKYFIKIRFDKRKSLIYAALGGAIFIFNIVLIFSDFNRYLLSNFRYHGIGTSFGPLFLIWQSVIGFLIMKEVELSKMLNESQTKIASH